MHTNNTLRSALAPVLVLVLTLAASALTTHAFACDCGKTSKAIATASTTAGSSQKETSRKHPLKGVVTDLLPAQDALMVKHEAIPGVMKAMTMMFVVDPTVLKTVKKGDAITALMYRTADGDWRLDDVKVIPSVPST
jgi:Cu/Ag efflux protein CusF